MNKNTMCDRYMLAVSHIRAVLGIPGIHLNFRIPDNITVFQLISIICSPLYSSQQAYNPVASLSYSDHVEVYLSANSQNLRHL
ncbi:hypothetical protein ABKN59_008202 [Abortiporus biennis]